MLRPRPYEQLTILSLAREVDLTAIRRRKTFANWDADKYWQMFQMF